MSLEQALHEIKSHEFAARLNVVSGMRAFFGAARAEPAVISIYRNMTESGEAREEVLGRLQDLAQLEINPRYENPNDTALAILLWLTESTAPAHSQMAAALVDRAPQCWYAKKLARRILFPPPVASGYRWAGELRSGPRSESMGTENALIIVNPGASLTQPRYYSRAKLSSLRSSALTIRRAQG